MFNKEIIFTKEASIRIASILITKVIIKELLNRQNAIDYKEPKFLPYKLSNKTRM